MHLMGHTCANLNGELLFIWGGTPSDHVGGGQQQHVANEERAGRERQQTDEQMLSRRNADLWIYETLTGYWRHRRCSGECPPYLSSCSSCLIGQKMFIFGGHSTELDDWLNCLYCLDLETFQWTDVGSRASAREPTKPIRSDKNVCWSHANKLYVFGGYGWSRTEAFMDILDRQRDFQLTPDFRWPKFGWNNQLVEFDPWRNTWRWPAYSGKCPSARAAHSGTLMGDGKFYLFGGRDSCERLNDLYTFDMKTFEWTQLAILDDGQPIQRPVISHLLESSAGDEHGQLSEEIPEAHSGRLVMAAEPMPSSSSSTDPGGQQASSLAHGSGKPIIDYQSDDDYEDDEEHPHPSHLLERWSLSSQQPPPDNSSEENSEPVRGRQPAGRSFCSFTPINDEIIILFGGVSSQDQNLSDCWQLNIRKNKWAPLMINPKHKRPRLWHSGSRTKQGEVVIIGGSSSDKIDEFCSDVLVISLEPRSLKRLALDAASRSVRLKTIRNCSHLPSTICKLIRLRKQAIALTSVSK